jgi:hypothetical protein
VSVRSCKKVVASGSRTTLLMREERCYGIANAKISNEANLGTWKRLELTSENIVNDIATLQSNALNPQRSVRRRVQGTSSVGGDVNVELANNGYGWLITQAIGKIIGSGTSADPYTILPVGSDGVASDETAAYQQNSDLFNPDLIHYDPTGSDDPQDSAGFESGYYEVDPYAMEPGFSMMVSRDGGTILDENGDAPTNELWFKYLGCKVNTMSITANPTDIITSTFSIMGRSEETVDVAAPSYIERPAANDPFTGFNGAVYIDNATMCLLSFDVTINNNLGGENFCLGDRFRNSLPEAQRVIEGTARIEFTSLVYYNKFKTGTAVSIKIVFDLLGDGTEVLRVILPRVEFNGTTPTAGGQEAMSQELPFTALWDRNPPNAILTKGAATVAPDGFDIAFEIVTAGQLV